MTVKDIKELERIREWYKDNPEGTVFECSKETGATVWNIYYYGKIKRLIPEYRLPAGKNITILGQELHNGMMFSELSSSFVSSECFSLVKGNAEGVNDERLNFTAPIIVNDTAFDRYSYIKFDDNMLSRIVLSAVADSANGKSVFETRKDIHFNWLNNNFGKSNTGRPWMYDFSDFTVESDTVLSGLRSNESDYIIIIKYKKKRGRFIVEMED